MEYSTLYPPTGETVNVSSGEGFLKFAVVDQAGETVAWRTLGREEMLALAKGDL